MRAHDVYNRADGLVIFVYLYSYPSTRVVNVTYVLQYLLLIVTVYDVTVE